MRHLGSALVLASIPLGLLAQAPAQPIAAIPTPPGITVQGIPPIPQSIADNLERYTHFRQAQMVAWHPTKRQIVIATTFEGTPQLHLVDGPGRSRSQLTWIRGAFSPAPFAAFDPADPNTLVFMYDPTGREGRSVFRYDMTTGNVTMAVASKTRFTPVWSRQGKWLAYDSSERNGKDRDLYVVQPADPATKRMVAQVEGAWSPQDWSPDGQTLLAVEQVANEEAYIWTINLKTGERMTLTPRGGDRVAWTDARFSADGRRVYAVSDKGSDRPRLMKCDLSTGAWTPLTPDGLPIDVTTDNGSNYSPSYVLSPDGDMVAALIDRGETNELQVMDLSTMKPRTLPAIPKGVISMLRWRPGSHEVGFSLATVKVQSDVYSLDASLGTLSRWTYSENDFNPDTLPAPEQVSWKSFDGTVITGTLYRPAARFTGPRPLMVQFHGGPDLRDRLRFQGRSNHFLNDLGVAILWPNVRGSSGFGRHFEDLDNGRHREDAVKDVGALLDWAAARPDIDKNRVVLFGTSYGGWLALESGIVYNGRVRGIVVGAAITNFVDFLEHTDPGRQENRRQEFGDERDPETRAFLTSISPVTRAKELKTPTFILVPGKDSRVPVPQALQLADALKANNATVWFANFTETNHDNFPGSNANNNWLLAAWVAFMKQFVLN